MLCNVDNMASIRRGMPCYPQSVSEPACLLHNLASAPLYLGRVVSLCPQLCVRGHMWSCLWHDLQKSMLSMLLPSGIQGCEWDRRIQSVHEQVFLLMSPLPPARWAHPSLHHAPGRHQ